MSGNTPSVEGIKYLSWLAHSGYGTAARRLLMGLRNLDVSFTWTPMVAGRLLCEPFRGNAVGDPELDPWCNRPIPYDTVILHMVPEYVLHCRCREPGKRLVLHTAWETDSIPHHWRFLLEQADLVIVPCSWNKTVFERAGVRTRIEVLPHILADPVQTAGNGPWSIPDKDFVFYAVEAWRVRKALREMLRCYLDTFTAEDPVTFVLKTDSRDASAPHLFGGQSTRRIVRSLIRSYPQPARICLLTNDLLPQDLQRLHTRANCYVSLSRGEGWGLGPFDAASYGKPVIATRFGGARAYLPEDAALFVDCSTVRVEDRAGRPSYSRDQHWAEADLAHASRLMTWAVEHREEAAARGKLLRRFVHANFKERQVVNRLMNILTSSSCAPPVEACTE